MSVLGTSPGQRQAKRSVAATHGECPVPRSQSARSEGHGDRASALRPEIDWTIVGLCEVAGIRARYRNVANRYRRARPV